MRRDPDNILREGGRRSTDLPSPSSSCVSMASMASMVAEGGGGEHVTPDKAMQMLKMQPQWKTKATHVRPGELFTGSAAQLRGTPCIVTERISINLEKISMKN